MAKIFSSIPPFLCKSSRLRKWVPVFDSHFVHDQVSNLNHLKFTFLFSYTSKLMSAFIIFSFEVRHGGSTVYPQSMF